MFSKACEYAIRAALYVAEQSKGGNRVGLKEIARATGSPEAYTAKILQQLVRKGILHSLKGPAGGFEIEAADLKRINLMQIVEAIDGDNVYNGCGLGLKECNAAKPCPVHDHFVSIRNDLKKMLSETNLAELANGLRDKKVFLKR